MPRRKYGHMVHSVGPTPTPRRGRGDRLDVRLGERDLARADLHDPDADPREHREAHGGGKRRDDELADRAEDENQERVLKIGLTAAGRGLIHPPDKVHHRHYENEGPDEAHPGARDPSGPADLDSGGSPHGAAPREERDARRDEEPRGRYPHQADGGEDIEEA